MYKEGWEGEVMHPHQKRVYPFFVKLFFFFLIAFFLAGTTSLRG